MISSMGDVTFECEPRTIETKPVTGSLIGAILLFVTHDMKATFLTFAATLNDVKTRKKRNLELQ